jgi:hypothetical protein
MLARAGVVPLDASLDEAVAAALDTVVAWGGGAGIRERLSEYVAAGVGEIAVSPYRQSANGSSEYLRSTFELVDSLAVAR